MPPALLPVLQRHVLRVHLATSVWRECLYLKILVRHGRATGRVMMVFRAGRMIIALRRNTVCRCAFPHSMAGAVAMLAHATGAARRNLFVNLGSFAPGRTTARPAATLVWRRVRV